MMTGASVNTVRSEMNTPFASARPRSGPILNCIKTRAKKPMMVVRADESIDANDISSASTIASFLSFVLSFSSLNLCITKTV